VWGAEGKKEQRQILIVFMVNLVGLRDYSLG
jgi:hypothetical protein